MSHQTVPVSAAASEALRGIFKTATLPQVFEFTCTALRKSFPEETEPLVQDSDFAKNARLAIAAGVKSHLDSASRRLGPKATAACIKKGFASATLAQMQVGVLQDIRAEVENENLRQQLLLDFGFEKLPGHIVAFEIPKGFSIVDLYERSEEILRFRCASADNRQALVFLNKLAKWKNNSTFTASFKQGSKRVLLQAIVEDCIGQDKVKQAELAILNGKQMASEWQLAAAFMLNFIANPGEDLFCGYDVRTKEGSLVFSQLGLKDSIFTDDCKSGKISAAFLDAA